MVATHNRPRRGSQELLPPTKPALSTAGTAAGASPFDMDSPMTSPLSSPLSSPPSSGSSLGSLSPMSLEEFEELLELEEPLDDMVMDEADGENDIAGQVNGKKSQVFSSPPETPPLVAPLDRIPSPVVPTARIETVTSSITSHASSTATGPEQGPAVNFQFHDYIDDMPTPKTTASTTAVGDAIAGHSPKITLRKRGNAPMATGALSVPPKDPVRAKGAAAQHRRMERLLTSSKSPLAKSGVDIRHVLQNPKAWAALNATAKESILEKFPNGQHVVVEANTIDGKPRARPDLKALGNDDNFRYQCSRYQENLASGRHDPEWIGQAFAANKRRHLGEYQSFIADKLNRDWDLPIRAKNHGSGPNNDGGCSKVTRPSSPTGRAVQEGLGIQAHPSTPMRTNIEVCVPTSSPCSSRPSLKRTFSDLRGSKAYWERRVKARLDDEGNGLGAPATPFPRISCAQPDNTDAPLWALPERAARPMVMDEDYDDDFEG